MMEWERFVAFVVVVAALIIVPGPSVIFVVSRGVALGRSAATLTALGNELGLLVQVVAVAFGLGMIVERSALVFTLLKIAGALYLVYLGVQTWRHRKKLVVAEDGAPPIGGSWRVLRQGFVVGASNPKGVLIFTSVLPQFVNYQAGGIPLQMLTLGAICVIIALLSDVAWGLLAGTARNWLARSPHRLSAIGTVSGATMVGLGVHLALSGQN
jgi:threonine/homoserine/homoserine lactone efflux protein